MRSAPESDRPPGVQPPPPPPLPRRGALLVAHGSRDPRAAPVAFDAARTVEAEVGSHIVRAAFLELADPDPAAALDELVAAGVGTVTVVPFRLGRAYHAKVDLPKVVQAAAERGLEVELGSVLGPDPTLATLLLHRLDEACRAAGGSGDSSGSGGSGGAAGAADAVVLAAAGSSDPEGNAGVFDLADRLSAHLGVPVTAGFASACAPTVEDAVAAAVESVPDGRVAVATYLLAPGYFADKIRQEAEDAGAFAVAEPLGAAPEIVALAAAQLHPAH